MNPETRVKLFTRLGVTEMATLRSFLDKPPTKGLTIKGSGNVGFFLHKRNHHMEVVERDSELHDQVMTPVSFELFIAVPNICILLCFMISLSGDNLYVSLYVS